MIETKEEFTPEYFSQSLSITMHREIIVIENGVEVGKIRTNSKAFVPGEIEDLKKHIKNDTAPIIRFCNALWTPDVIAAQKALNKET